MRYTVQFRKGSFRGFVGALTLIACAALTVVPIFDSYWDQPVAADQKGLGVCTIGCPDDIEFTTGGCVGQASFNYDDPTFVGDCTRMSFTYDPPEGTFFQVGYHNVVCTAENGSKCTFQIKVKTSNDTTKPEIVCPEDIIIPAKLGTQSAKIKYDVEGSDNCSAKLLYQQLTGLPSGEKFPQGTTTNTWRVTDASGNTDQCSFDVTVLRAIGLNQPSNTTVFQGLKTPIRWKTGGFNDQVRIELFRDGAFVRIIKAATPDDGVFKWRVPENLPTGNGYVVRVSFVLDPTIFDESDEPFRVKSLP